MVNFNEYPYRNLTDLNLDYLEKKMNVLKEIMDTFVTLNTVTFADPIIWNITTQYSRNTVVLDTAGNAYLSKVPVPAGVQLNNSDFWLEIFNFTEYTRTANQNLTINVETNTTRATHAYNVDDWLIWNDVLYKVTSAIAVDDTLMIGTNIVHFTVEDFIKAFMTWATNTIQQYKNDIDASELQYRQQLAQDIANTTASLQAQLNVAISGATVDSEVLNARVDLNSYVWDTLGNAIRGQIARVLSVIDRENSMANNEQFSFTWLQGFHGTNGGTFTPDNNQIESDFFVVPTGTTIEVKTTRATSQVSVKEWQRTATAYQRVRIVQGAQGAPVTVSDTNSNYFYTVSVYNANGIDVSDPRANANLYNGIKNIYDIIATAPYYRDGITDLNSMTDAGFYNINSSGYSNIPSDFTSNGVLFVVRGAQTTRIIQILGSYATRDIWIRNAGANNGFDSWIKLLAENKINLRVSGNDLMINWGTYGTKLHYEYDASIHRDNWNLDTITKNNNVIVPSGTDMLGPLELVGNVFVGGVHGYETTNNLTIIADGNIYDRNTITDLDCHTLQILIASSLYEPNNMLNIADRFIKIYFDGDKIYCESTFTFKTSITIERALNCGMIAARNDILQSIALNNMFIAAPTASVSGTIKKENNSCSMITSKGTVTLTAIKGQESDDFSGRLIVYTNESPVRSKFYADRYKLGAYNMTAGDMINGAFEIVVN